MSGRCSLLESKNCHGRSRLQLALPLTARPRIRREADVDAGDLLPGSVVEVEVRCEAALVAGRTATFQARAVEVVDRYRQGDA